MSSLFLVTLFALFTAPTAFAGSSCIAFDTNWNLLAFGFNGKDYNVGTSDSWASGMTLPHIFICVLNLGNRQANLPTLLLPEDRELPLTLSSELALTVASKAV
jgi:hypothetical protein